ncbi:photosynthetic complex assembly protein PuhC [Acuticoccus sp. MNP-M23]|uniref:photosynthetic complex assembly protein PuhC n=1 Tax=Acuticoccus sp. MNP-M23 TaxID=3072793 RepID=UPI002815B802|nr:photosynthetic complex assembly protein PuhC [Acuticoccus sp. MNP-M23]WMS42706.1 photosynthetic complex assembly protein PuhC [Acuticoccus sp. MNP-M23]
MAQQDPFIPKGTLRMVFALVSLSLTAVVISVLMVGTPHLPATPDEPRQIVLITVDDTADGGISIVSDAGTTILAPDSHGFIRGVLRALARQRHVQKIGPEEPFVISEDQQGRFAIADPQTGARIDLRAFGSDNTIAFASLMPTFATHNAGE